MLTWGYIRLVKKSALWNTDTEGNFSNNNETNKKEVVKLLISFPGEPSQTPANEEILNGTEWIRDVHLDVSKLWVLKTKFRGKKKMNNFLALLISAIFQGKRIVSVKRERSIDQGSDRNTV